GGEIEQVGTGGEIYRKPTTRFVADFIGEANFIECVSVAPDALRPSIGSTNIRYVGSNELRRYTAILRPEHVSLIDAPAPGLSCADGIVEDAIDIGMHSTLRIRVAEQVISCRKLNDALSPVRGSPVKIGFRPEDLHILED